MDSSATDRRLFLPQSSAERLIAATRVGLALATMGALLLGVIQASRFGLLATALLSLFTAYSLGICAWTLAASRTWRVIAIATYAADLVFFGVLNTLTSAPASVYFVTLVFLLFCAALRFRRSRLILAAAAALAVAALSAVAPAVPAADPPHQLLVRIGCGAAIATLLLLLAAVHQDGAARVERLARWPASNAKTQDALVGDLLRETASIFNVPRILIVYAHVFNRYAFSGTWDGQSFTCTAERPEIADQLLDGEGQSGQERLRQIATDASSACEEPMHELPPVLAETYGVRSALATSFASEFITGQLLLMDRKWRLREEMMLAKIAGAIIASRLEQFHSAEQRRRTAIAEERVRVARDLHDSVLQSLSGVALQLSTLPHLTARDAEAATKRLSEVQQVIFRAQQELRWMIQQLRPDELPEEDSIANGLMDRLSSLAEDFRDQWGLTVKSTFAPVVKLLPLTVRHQIYAIVNEAVANAARHASPTFVRVEVNVVGPVIEIVVEDDGRGFPFHGRYCLKELLEKKRGPMTLKERVAALRGDLILDSSPRGAKLHIRLPITMCGA